MTWWSAAEIIAFVVVAGGVLCSPPGRRILGYLLRTRILALPLLVVLAAPFILPLIVLSMVLPRYVSSDTADAIIALAIWPPTMLLLWVLLFANRRPPARPEGPLRRAARFWGGLGPWGGPLPDDTSGLQGAIQRFARYCRPASVRRSTYGGTE